MKNINKKSVRMSSTAVLLALMICLIAALAGCDNKQTEEETQNPFQSVFSPETTEKPDGTTEKPSSIKDSGINEDKGWNDIN